MLAFLFNGMNSKHIVPVIFTHIKLMSFGSCSPVSKTDAHSRFLAQRSQVSAYYEIQRILQHRCVLLQPGHHIYTWVQELQWH